MPIEIDLTPFGFTATESEAYAALLRLGPSTGYAVAHATRVARHGTRGARAAGRGGRARRSEPNPQRDRVGGHTHRAADRRRANAGRGGERRNSRRDVEFAPGGRRPGPRVDPGPRVRRLLLLLLCAVGACRAAALPEAQLFPAGTQFTARYLPVEGTRIRYIDAGHGAPVVFLHGLGASMYAWRNNLGAVAAAGFRVIAFDNRGFGLSDKPPAPYDNAAYARLAIAFMDSLGLPDAVLVGHSMGGAIAAEVAIAYPRRVRGLGLAGSAGLGTREPLLFRVVRWPVLGPAVLAFRGRGLTARLLKSTYFDPRKVTEADVDQYYAPVALPDYARAFRRALRQLRLDDPGGPR